MPSCRLSPRNHCDDSAFGHLVTLKLSEVDGGHRAGGADAQDGSVNKVGGR
jgi:hypothetical protein